MTLPTQDLAAQIREAAATALRDYGVALGGAAVPVESERVDPLEDGALPRIVIYADDNGSAASRGGTAPSFDVTLQLVVQALVGRALRADAVADIDALVAQIKDGLFGDAGWVKLSAGLPSYRVTRSFKADGSRVVGDARMLVEATWRETYAPRVTQHLRKIVLTTEFPAGTPAATQTLSLPE